MSLIINSPVVFQFLYNAPWLNTEIELLKKMAGTVAPYINEEHGFCVFHRGLVVDGEALDKRTIKLEKNSCLTFSFVNASGVSWEFTPKNSPVPHILGSCYKDAIWSGGQWDYGGDKDDLKNSSMLVDVLRKNNERFLLLNDPAEILSDLKT